MKRKKRATDGKNIGKKLNLQLLWFIIAERDLNKMLLNRLLVARTKIFVVR